MSVRSEYRRNRKKKRRLKSEITKKDKILGILAIVVLFLVAVFLVVYVAFSNA